MKPRTVLAGVAAATVVACLGIHNKHRRAERGTDPAGIRAKIEKHLARALDRIDATNYQQREIIRIAQPLIDDVATQLADGGHGEMREEFLKAWSSNEMNASRLDSLIDDHAIDLRHLSRKAVQTIAEVHAVLTPEQREQVADVVGRTGHFGWH